MSSQAGFAPPSQCKFFFSSREASREGIHSNLASSFEILRSEAQRLWLFWLGMPVPPRAWDVKIPGSDNPMGQSVDHAEL